MDKGKKGIQVIDLFDNQRSSIYLKDVLPTVVRSAFGDQVGAKEFQVLDFFTATLDFSQLPMNFPDHLQTEGGFRSKGIFQEDSIAYLGWLT